MKTIRQRNLWLVLLIALLAMTALTFVVSARLRAANTNQKNAAANAKVKQISYVRRSRLSPKLAWHINALGDRLERPGKERLSMKGTLQRTGESQAAEVAVVFEFPDRLRVRMQKGNQARDISFNRGQANAAGNSLDEVERDLIETLAYGSAEHFFATQMEGQATRLVGTRFRLDDGTASDYPGPYYDVYKVAETIAIAADQRDQIKFYYFNSDTLLLERVSYEIFRNGSTIKVEERLSDWTKEQGQQVARRIERIENGESVFVFTVRTAGLSARVDDGTFEN